MFLHFFGFSPVAALGVGAIPGSRAQWRRQRQLRRVAFAARPRFVLRPFWRPQFRAQNLPHPEVGGRRVGTHRPTEEIATWRRFIARCACSSGWGLCLVWPPSRLIDQDFAQLLSIDRLGLFHVRPIWLHPKTAQIIVKSRAAPVRDQFISGPRRVALKSERRRRRVPVPGSGNCDSQSSPPVTSPSSDGTPRRVRAKGGPRGACRLGSSRARIFRWANGRCRRGGPNRAKECPRRGFF